MNVPGGTVRAGGLNSLLVSKGQDDGRDDPVALYDALRRADRGVGQEGGAIGSAVVAPVGGDRLSRRGRRAEGQRDDQQKRETRERDASTG